MNNPKPVNVVSLKDDKRKITIFFDENKKILVHTEDYEEVDETLTEYSIESFIKMKKLTDLMFNELVDTSSDFRKEVLSLVKNDKSELKIRKV